MKLIAVLCLNRREIKTLQRTPAPEGVEYLHVVGDKHGMREFEGRTIDSYAYSPQAYLVPSPFYSRFRLLAEQAMLKAPVSR